MHKLIRSAAASMVVCATLVFGGCAAGGSGGSGSNATPTPGAIEVEEELFTVDLKVSRSLLDPNDELTDEDIVSAASSEGIAAVVDGDTVIYTMNKQQRDELLAEMRSSAQNVVEGMIDDDSNSVTGIEFDDAMRSFRVAVDGARYTPMESLLVLAFYIQGALYQQFSGVPQGEIDVVVEFVDDATGDVLNTGSYQEMRENLEK